MTSGVRPSAAPGAWAARAGRASSRRLSARAWLTCPYESGSDQRSWTGCSCRTSGEVRGVLGPPVGALGVVRVGVDRPLLGLGQDHLGRDLLHPAAPDTLLLRQQLRAGLDVVLGDIGQRLGARLLLRRHAFPPPGVEASV